MITNKLPSTADSTLTAANDLSNAGGVKSAWDASVALGLSGALNPIKYAPGTLEEMMSGTSRRLIIVEVVINGISHFVVVTGEVYDSAKKMCRFTVADPGYNVQYLDQYDDVIHNKSISTIRGFLP
ncbi:MAG TPA: hypothetical protein VFR02_05840 [bacterium]|nr:hypothetical protein [bacterium]